MEDWVVIAARALAQGHNRHGLVVRWYLHGGSEYRTETVGLEHIHPQSEVREPGDQGKLIVFSIWAEMKCITPLRRAQPEELKKPGAFEVYEEIAIGITSPGQVVKFTGPPEDLERLIAFYLQSGGEVYGLSEEERKRFLQMYVET